MYGSSIVGNDQVKEDAIGTTSRIHVIYVKYTESYVWNTGKDKTTIKTKVDGEVSIKIHPCKMVWEVSDWVN
jgi:hypothetical protein